MPPSLEQKGVPIMSMTPPRGDRSIGFLSCIAFIPILALMGSLGDAHATAGPTVTSVTPSFAKPGSIVSIRGSGFGATRGSGYVRLSDAGGNSGAPHDAGLQIDSWSASLITFVLPLPSGATGQWRVIPGTKATVTVTQSGATSKSAKLSVANTDNLADYFGNDGISPDNNRRCGANFDVGNAEDAYSANLLAKDGIKPAGTV
ncbi:MAG TPA: IPT/TIG domain-containing protein, partial [Chloroflexota bacterium]|nr:IPT/TIG domain-containing protein [Chloroflexota bacterium]